MRLFAAVRLSAELGVCRLVSSDFRGCVGCSLARVGEHRSHAEFSLAFVNQLKTHSERNAAAIHIEIPP